MNALMHNTWLHQWVLPIHRSLALLTITIFIWRGVYVWKQKPMPKLYRRFIPDVIDVCLLTSGILLAFVLGIAPWQHAWLATKLTVIVLYIVAGFFAFRESSIMLQRSAFFLSLGLFMYIVSIAHTMRPMPWL